MVFTMANSNNMSLTHMHNVTHTEQHRHRTGMYVCMHTCTVTSPETPGCHVGSISTMTEKFFCTNNHVFVMFVLVGTL